MQKELDGLYVVRRSSQLFRCSVVFFLYYHWLYMHTDIFINIIPYLYCLCCSYIVEISEEFKL